jgi:hypothetical protein
LDYDAKIEPPYLATTHMKGPGIMGESLSYAIEEIFYFVTN